MEKLTINKSGQFVVKTFGPNHCGTQPVQSIRFSVRIKADGADLDARGFLFDQLEIQTYFDSIHRTSLSCERLAEASIASLRRLVTRENSRLHVEYVYVSLSPDPYTAMIECEWYAPAVAGA